MKRILLFFFLFPFISLSGIEFESLKAHLRDHPFDYELATLVLEGTTPNQDVMLCCHGMGGSEETTNRLHTYGLIPHHLVGFRFPDYGPSVFNRPPEKTRFGTIHELLPILFHLKRLVIDARLEKIHLYGFSAGGGALVNALAVLNQNRFPELLQEIGIDEKARLQILAAIQKGWVVLECPLKSLDEVIAYWEIFEPLQFVAARYQRNGFRPIEALHQLLGLKLNVLLYFQDPDLVIFNRDDALYIHNLTWANPNGYNIVLIRDEGGHSVFHQALWQRYAQIDFSQ